MNSETSISLDFFDLDFDLDFSESSFLKINERIGLIKSVMTLA